MKKERIILTILLILIFPIISAALPQPVERGSCVGIKIPLNVSAVNITTLTFPNQTLLIRNFTTTRAGSTFFNNSFCTTQDLGIYTYEFLANDGFVSGNSFTVTEDGTEMDEGQSNIYVILLIINLLFLVLFIFLSIKIPYGNDLIITDKGPAIQKVSKLKYAKLFSMWITYFLFFWLITMLAGIVNNYISFQPLKDMAMNLYFFTQALGYGVSVTMIWFIFLNLWRDIILNKIVLKEGVALLRDLEK